MNHEKRHMLIMHSAIQEHLEIKCHCQMMIIFKPYIVPSPHKPLGYKVHNLASGLGIYVFKQIHTNINTARANEVAQNIYT